MVDELLFNALHGKNSNDHDNKFEFLHSSSSNIDSYVYYLIAITMAIYHELSEYR